MLYWAGGVKFGDPRQRPDADPTVAEVPRNWPVRQPLLWV